jgi:predicted amidohydrolase
MKKDSIKLGIVVAQPNKGLEELERFISDEGAEFFLFPEAFLDLNDVQRACDLIKANKKWLVCGVEDQKQKFQKAIVINPEGKVVGEHKKTSITQSEVDRGFNRGDKLDVIETDFGKIGVSICYEIHFPEISRIYALKGAKIVFNPVGTGMWHEKQYRQWTSIASARASENEIFVFGCSHFNDAIPFEILEECQFHSTQIFIPRMVANRCKSNVAKLLLNRL